MTPKELIETRFAEIKKHSRQCALNQWKGCNQVIKLMDEIRSDLLKYGATKEEIEVLDDVSQGMRDWRDYMDNLITRFS